MSKLLKEEIPQTILSSALADIATLKTQLTPYAVVLTAADKHGLRTMAEGREGYVRLIARIAVAHTESLARNDEPSELVGSLNYDQQLEDIRQQIMSVLEQITNIQIANSKDIMTLADRYATSLQAGRTSNSALDAAMHEIDEWNKRYGAKKGTTGTSSTDTTTTTPTQS